VRSPFRPIEKSFPRFFRAGDLLHFLFFFFTSPPFSPETRVFLIFPPEIPRPFFLNSVSPRPPHGKINALISFYLIFVAVTPIPPFLQPAVSPFHTKMPPVTFCFFFCLQPDFLLRRRTLMFPSDLRYFCSAFSRPRPNVDRGFSDKSSVSGVSPRFIHPMSVPAFNPQHLRSFLVASRFFFFPLQPSCIFSDRWCSYGFSALPVCSFL